MVVALGCVPALARAQESVADASLDRVAAILRAADSPGIALPSDEQLRQPLVRAELPPSTGALLSSLYISTAVMQGLDLHSTFAALSHGAVEANPMVSPISSHPVAFVAAKSAVAVTTIYAAHRLSKRHKTAAAGMLVAVNSAYAVIVAHNYRVGAGR
jgi:hypothetical protein